MKSSGKDCIKIINIITLKKSLVAFIGILIENGNQNFLIEFIIYNSR